MTSMSARGASPLSSLSRPMHQNHVDYVPAVFPFPEPIPMGPPVRRQSGGGPGSVTARSRGDASRADSLRGASVSDSDPSFACTPFAEDLKHQAHELTTEDPLYDMEAWLRVPRRERVEHDPNKEQANAWISQCAPKTWLLEHERSLWKQRKIWFERDLKAKEAMNRNMATMPFDLWLEMKQGLAESEASRHEAVMARLAHLQEDNARGGATHKQLAEAQLKEAAKQEEQELRVFYKALASKRRREMKDRHRAKKSMQVDEYYDIAQAMDEPRRGGVLGAAALRNKSKHSIKPIAGRGPTDPRHHGRW